MQSLVLTIGDHYQELADDMPVPYHHTKELAKSPFLGQIPSDT